MSRVIPDVGCRPASYWSYVTAVITRALSDASRYNGLINPVPPNVLGCARKFFQITLEQETGDLCVDNILAQLHTQAMARRWFHAICPEATSKEFLRCMQDFLSLLDRLSHTENTTLNISEQTTAEQLIVFYRKLRREADEDQDRLRHREIDE